MEVLYSGGLKRLNKLILRHFSWDLHSEIVKTFHEDIVVSNIRPEHITEQEFKVLLRTSEKHGLPAYMRALREAYDKGEDGMFIWEVEGRVIGWSWLKVYQNEFFKEGVYGEINEIYVIPEWRNRGIGKRIIEHALSWFKDKGVRTIRVEVLASNDEAIRFYKKFGFKPNYMSMQMTLESELL